MKKTKDSLKNKELVRIQKLPNGSFQAYIKEVYDFGYEKIVKKIFNTNNKEELEYMLNESGVDVNKIEARDEEKEMKDSEEKLYKVRVKGHPEALKEVREYLLSQGYSIDYDGYIIFVKGVTEEEGHALATDIVKKFDKVVCAVSTFTWDSIEPNANYTHVVYMWPNAGYELIPFYVNSDTEDTATLIAEALAQAIENGQRMFYFTEEDLEDLTDEEKDTNYVYFDLSELGLPNVYISEEQLYNTKVYTKEEDPYKKTEEKAETESPVEDSVNDNPKYKEYKTRIQNAKSRQELREIKEEILKSYNSGDFTEYEFKILKNYFDKNLDKVKDCNTVKDEPTKMTYGEISDIFYKHNKENNIKNQFEDPNALEAVIVFSSDNWPNNNYSLESRSYKFSSDNKAFLTNMIGNSVFGESLDGTDRIRIDWYLHDWKVDYCYLLSNDNNVEKEAEVEDCDTVKDEANPKNVILVKIDGEWKTWGGTNRDKLEEDSRYEELVKKYGKENIKFEPNKVKDSGEEVDITIPLAINLKEWYTKEFPTDPEGEYLNEDITLQNVYDFINKYGCEGPDGDLYDYIGAGDSLVRERIFAKISEALNVPYNDIYNKWLRSGVNDSKKTKCKDSSNVRYYARVLESLAGKKINSDNLEECAKLAGISSTQKLLDVLDDLVNDMYISGNNETLTYTIPLEAYKELPNYLKWYDSKSVKCKDSFKVEFFIEGNLLEGKTEEGFETYQEAEDFAEEEVAIISQNGIDKEIPLEEIAYEITYVHDGHGENTYEGEEDFS